MTRRIQKRIGNKSSKTEYRAGTVRTTVEYKSSDLEIDIDVDAIVKSITDGGAIAVTQGIHAISASTKDGAHPQFKGTGTLVNGITSRVTGTGTAEVVAPPDRLQEQVVFERMIELVPVLGEPLGNVGTAPINDAIDKAVRDVVKVGR